MIPGGKPKFTLGERRRKIETPIPENSLARGGFKSFTESDVPLKRIVDKTRKHFEPSLSETAQWRPSRRTLKPNVSPPRPEGKRLVPGPKPEESRRSNRNCPPKKESGFQDPEPKLFLSRSAVRNPENGERAADKRSDSTTLDEIMTRKHPVTEQRNGIGEANLGDKAYTTPEYSSNFYKEEGSTVPIAVYGRKSVGRTSQDVIPSNKVYLTPSKLMQQQLAREEREQDIKSVTSDLDAFDRKMGWLDSDTED